ncbi:unnamed protein product, partial [Mesorhabditis spiculigera]
MRGVFLVLAKPGVACVIFGLTVALNLHYSMRELTLIFVLALYASCQCSEELEGSGIESFAETVEAAVEPPTTTILPDYGVRLRELFETRKNPASERQLREQLDTMADEAYYVNLYSWKPNPSILPPLDQLPSQMLAIANAGKYLPGLDFDKTKQLWEYYNVTAPLTPAPKVQLLPEGYPLTNIPYSVVRSLRNNEMPDLNLLPEDLKEHFKSQTERYIVAYMKGKADEVPMEDLMSKIPIFPRPDLPAYPAYELADIRQDLYQAEAEVKRERLAWILMMIVLCSMTFTSIMIIIFLTIRTRRQKPEPARSLPGSPVKVHIAAYQKKDLIEMA